MYVWDVGKWHFRGYSVSKSRAQWTVNRPYQLKLITLLQQITGRKTTNHQKGPKKFHVTDHPLWLHTITPLHPETVSQARSFSTNHFNSSISTWYMRKWSGLTWHLKGSGANLPCWKVTHPNHAIINVHARPLFRNCTVHQRPMTGLVPRG